MRLSALKDALQQGDWLAPLRTRRTRAAAARALRRIGNTAAIEALREASTRGSRGVRSAAKAELGQLMTEPLARAALYEELLRRMASGVRAAQLYAPDHPLVARNMEGLITVLRQLHQQQPSVAVGIVGHELVVADTPMPKVSASMTELIRRLKDNHVERIAFERGVTAGRSSSR